ncbi:MAG: molecular chaperone [Rhodoferax sp.]|nr:molecular chaperone [Rhodoferax sp.]
MSKALAGSIFFGFLRLTATGWFIGYALLFCSLAHSELQFDGTRVVYRQNRKDVSITLQNISPDKPTLFQAWIGEYDSDASPEDSTAPFLLSPPIARLNALGRQTLRITFTGEQQATERETLYSLNILELPAAAKAQSEALIRVAVLTRLKLLFRPTGLKGTPENAMRQLKCKVKRTGDQPMLACHNASGFYLSFFGFQAGNASVKGPESPSGMINPQSHTSFPLNDVDKFPSELTAVTFRFIDDIGATVSVELALSSD